MPAVPPIYMIYKKKNCKYCNKNFYKIEGRVFSNHMRWCDKNPNPNKFSEKARKKARKRFIIYNKKRSKEYRSNIFSKEVKCHICKKIFSIKEHKTKIKEKYFCNQRCANTYSSSFVNRKNLVVSKETRKKISEGIKKLWTNEEYSKKQLNACKKFNSKAEIELRELFIGRKNTDWTFGGPIKTKGCILIRDLYSKKLKINIELDGIWHFKDIFNQLKDKRKKDKLLLKWSLENDYKLIRISHKFYLKNKNEILTFLNKCFKNKKKKIFLFGEEFKKVHMYKKYID